MKRLILALLLFILATSFGQPMSPATASGGISIEDRSAHNVWPGMHVMGPGVPRATMMPSFDPNAPGPELWDLDPGIDPPDGTVDPPVDPPAIARVYADVKEAYEDKLIEAAFP